jgi:hypothetical protein
VAKQVAYAGAHYAAKKAGEWTANKIYKQITPANKTKHRAYHTHGSYAGNFKKSRKTTTPTTKYANKGMLQVSEINGSITDANIVYISHTAGDAFKIVQHSVTALIRKLFQKAGVTITSPDMILIKDGIPTRTAAGWLLELTSYNGASGVESSLINYTTITGDTLLLVSAVFKNSFIEFSSGYHSSTTGGAAGNDIILKKFNLYQVNDLGSVDSSLAASIELCDEILHVYTTSELKIQNRTLAADAGSDALDVSNNPLIGRNYRFNGMPKIRQTANGVYKLNTIPINSGIQLVKGGELPINMREPPDPSQFSNCKGSAKIKLEPGQIKMSKLTWKKSMNFLTFLSKLNIQFGTTSNYAYHTIVPCEIFALEDMINVTASQLINCAYETNQILGAYLTTRRRANGIQGFEQYTVNNLT